MAFESSKLICIVGNTGCSHWAYTTIDAPEDVLAPGYFGDGNQGPGRPTCFPGEVITVTCFPPHTERRILTNPVAVFQCVTARSMGNVWLTEQIGLVSRPQNLVDRYYRADGPEETEEVA
jgi:hypothetical protein|tara:strand:+ start:398 stop:757 length:360 start_codon:yes stop_codon:yes gene_type:complete